MWIRSSAKSVVFAGARRVGINFLLRKAWQGRLLVLCYHGVIPEDHPEDLVRTLNAVSLREFREQLRIVCRLFNPVSAEDVLYWLERKATLPSRPVLITLDDGYRNNLTCAAPELERQSVPALIFVTTGYIGQNRLLWPQELVERILGWQGKTLPMPENQASIPMPTDLRSRVAVTVRVRSLCKQIADSSRTAYLDRLRSEPLRCGEDWHRELHGFLSWDDVRALGSRGFAIGSHCVEHSILTRLCPKMLDQELRQSKATIERELGEECPWIAYPNGGRNDFSPEVTRLATEAGYKVGFTLMAGLNSRSPTPLEIDRVCILGQRSQNEFHARISGLVSLRTALARERRP